MKGCCFSSLLSPPLLSSQQRLACLEETVCLCYPQRVQISQRDLFFPLPSGELTCENSKIILGYCKLHPGLAAAQSLMFVDRFFVFSGTQFVHLYGSDALLIRTIANRCCVSAVHQILCQRELHVHYLVSFPLNAFEIQGLLFSFYLLTLALREVKYLSNVTKSMESGFQLWLQSG